MKKPALSMVLPALVALLATGACTQKTPEHPQLAGHSGLLVREPLTAKRIIWLSDTTGTYIKHPDRLLKPGNGQADLSTDSLVILTNAPGYQASMILDFGIEIQGAIRIVTGLSGDKTPVQFRIRLGESVAETMSEIQEGGTATNDHAMRDFIITLPWLGMLETGNSGFRFARIDMLGNSSTALIKEISAISIFRDLPYLGSFRCNDELLNRIWKTGAYTVHLNMQEYLWDGIKRDRLVWVGDLNPEVMTALTVFGSNGVINKSLDLIRDITPVDQWMNGISSYSMWWIIIHRDLFDYSGDMEYLKIQGPYLTALLRKFCSMVDSEGHEHLDGHRFLDWPSSPDKSAVDAGYHGLLMLAFEAGAQLCTVLGEKETTDLCRETVSLMSKVTFDRVESKQAAALLGLAGILQPRQAAAVITQGGAERFSTFYGYYMLQALALSGNHTEALELVREYWGGMLQLGATTFWEDFNVEWLNNAGRIDELPAAGKVDVHGTYGDYCYRGYRHSYCHGWASGPTPWLSAEILGIKILEPGCKKVKIVPHLGDLEWVEGTFPTPLGTISIRHDRQPDGKIKSRITAPDGIEVVK